LIPLAKVTAMLWAIIPPFAAPSQHASAWRRAAGLVTMVADPDRLPPILADRWRSRAAISKKGEADGSAAALAVIAAAARGWRRASQIADRSDPPA